MCPPTSIRLDPIRNQRGKLLLPPAEAVVGVLHDGKLEVGAGAEGIGEGSHAAGDVVVAVLIAIAVEHKRRFADSSKMPEQRLAPEAKAAHRFEEGEDVVV